MKLLITGKDGQLGSELLRRIPKDAEAVGYDQGELDVTDKSAVDARVEAFAPDVVINCAAYTAVDAAESDGELAARVNVEGVEYLARACDSVGARLVHVSTDFVFTSTHSSPIAVDAPTDPAGVYAVTKRDGENVASKLLGDKLTLVRTSWLYSAFGGNFVKTMIRLMNERTELGIVSDQVGTPTWAGTLASSLWSLVDYPENEGTWHVTDAGVASWYDFAVAIYEDASAFGFIESECAIRPIRTSDYPTAARRPTYSVLDASRARAAGVLETRHWRESLRHMLGDLLDEQ